MLELAIFIAVGALAAVIAGRFLHMLQLASYQWKGYLRWLKSEGFKFPLNYIPFFPRGKAKKPLVYTSRVWRIFVTFQLIFIASLVLLHRLEFLPLLVIPYLLVPFLIPLANTLLYPIQKLINNWYIRDAQKMLRPDLKIIGITGSYGKTSVKGYISQLLSLKYNVLATPASFNTPMGVVRAIRENLQPSHSVFICEMGARHIGNIKELCKIVRPKYGVLTAIGPQHLDTFKTIDNIARTKFELIEGLPPDGKAFLSWTYPKIRERGKIRETVKYATLSGEINREELDIYAENLSADKNGMSFDVVLAKTGERERFSCPLLGRHNAENIVAAIALALELGIELKEMHSVVRRLKPAKHRLELLPKGEGLTVIDDAYNCNPVGAAAALEALSMFSGLKIIITPGMVELGELEEAENFALGEKITKVCDYAALVGERQTKPILEGILSTDYDKNLVKVFPSFTKAYNWAISIDEGERTVLLLNDLPDNY